MKNLVKIWPSKRVILNVSRVENPFSALFEVVLEPFRSCLDISFGCKRLT